MEKNDKAPILFEFILTGSIKRLDSRGEIATRRGEIVTHQGEIATRRGEIAKCPFRAFVHTSRFYAKGPSGIYYFVV